MACFQRAGAQIRHCKRASHQQLDYSKPP
ncbi:hypothetical protein AYI69_g1941, partial [Smittium culicis]